MVGFDYITSGMLSCPTCGVSTFTSITAPTDAYPAVTCDRCGLGIERRLELSDDCYSRESYSKTRSYGTEKNPWLRWHHDVAVAEHRMVQIQKVTGTVEPRAVRRWLDFGCGAGAVPTVARRHRYTAIGVEYHTKTIVADVYRFSSRNWMSDTKFPSVHVVSAFDVIEHLPDPTRLIQAADRDLHKDPLVPGYLVLEVPDLSKTDDFAKWKHRRTGTASGFTEHIWHFSERSLGAMVARYSGLRPVHVAEPVPGKLQMIWRTK
jgi:hypothetical protein